MAGMMLVVMVAAAVFANHAMAGSSSLNGVVECSFDDTRGLIRTANYIYLIRTRTLAQDQQALMAHIGSRIVLRRSPELIEAAWPLSGDVKTSVLGRTTRVKQDSIKAENGQLRITGISHYSTTPDREGFIEVGDVIFRVKRDLLTHEERDKLDLAGAHVVLRAPAESLDYAWTTSSGTSATRIIAKASEAPLRHRVRWRDGSLNIRGLILVSFDDSMILIQSDRSIFELRRAALPDSDTRNSSPGRTVELHAPANSVALAWMANGR